MSQKSEKKFRDRKVVPEKREVEAQLKEQRQDWEEFDRELRELFDEDDSPGNTPDDDFFEELRRDLAQLMAPDAGQEEEE
ncbi:MAG: hypothetical protein HYS78_00300 [Parcubacteria group bacterium]|nr:hypothetical protein [Parcubacteria group bacterium]